MNETLRFLMIKSHLQCCGFEKNIYTLRLPCNEGQQNRVWFPATETLNLPYSATCKSLCQKTIRSHTRAETKLAFSHETYFYNNIHFSVISVEKSPQQKLRKHRSLKAFCATRVMKMKRNMIRFFHLSK